MLDLRDSKPWRQRLAAALGLAPAPWIAAALVLVLGPLAVTAGHRPSRAATEVLP